jgi:hypothetical protein
MANFAWRRLWSAAQPAIDRLRTRVRASRCLILALALQPLARMVTWR